MGIKEFFGFGETVTKDPNAIPREQKLKAAENLGTTSEEMARFGEKVDDTRGTYEVHDAVTRDLQDLQELKEDTEAERLADAKAAAAIDPEASEPMPMDDGEGEAEAPVEEQKEQVG